MFTGIVEAAGVIKHIQQQGSNKDFWISAPFTDEIKVDQSIAHNGVCLTVVEVSRDQYRVTVVAETLKKTTLDNWQVGDELNLERSLRIGDRLDGHFVQGHIDCTAECVDKKQLNGSWLFQFHFHPAFASLIIEKGSICINGVSLTAFDVSIDRCMVTIIPFTYEHTSFKYLTVGDIVNFEFDVLGKYLNRGKELSKNAN